MNLIDLFNHEIGLFTKIMKYLSCKDLGNMVISYKINQTEKDIITQIIIKKIMKTVKKKYINVILPWYFDEPDTPRNIHNFILNHKDDILIKRTKGLSTGKISVHEMDQKKNVPIIYRPSFCFQSINEPYYSDLHISVNVDKPEVILYNIDIDYVIGTKIHDINNNSSKWDVKKYLLVSPFIFKEITKKISRAPVKISTLFN